MTEINTCQVCGMVYDMEESDAENPDLFCSHNCEIGNDEFDRLPKYASKGPIEKIRRKKKPHWVDMFA